MFEPRKRRKEVLTKNFLSFRYSYSIKSPNNKIQRRTPEIHQRTNVAILDDFIGDDVLTESDWSEEGKALEFNISI